jgi:hypothetical protein
LLPAAQLPNISLHTFLDETVLRHRGRAGLTTIDQRHGNTPDALEESDLFSAGPGCHCIHGVGILKERLESKCECGQVPHLSVFGMRISGKVSTLVPELRWTFAAF